MLLVIDINTNRVIFYTSDRSASLVLTKNTSIVDYSGPWPEEITLTTKDKSLINEKQFIQATYVYVKIKASLGCVISVKLQSQNTRDIKSVLLANDNQI